RSSARSSPWSGSAPRTRRWNWPTTPATAWPAASGRPTRAAPSASPSGCGTAPCGSTTSTRTYRRPSGAASAAPASGASSVRRACASTRRPSTSTRTSPRGRPAGSRAEPAALGTHRRHASTPAPRYSSTPVPRYFRTPEHAKSPDERHSMAAPTTPHGAESSYDYVIVGGGTAGCVLAARLSEDPDCRVCVIEGGPSDVGDERVLRLRNWINLLGTEYDYGYTTVEQPRGNSHILHSRARVLGGCSSHNTLISFMPLPEDLDDWVAAGCAGWDPATILPYRDRLLTKIVPVAEADRNPIAKDFVTAASRATG